MNNNYNVLLLIKNVKTIIYENLRQQGVPTTINYDQHKRRQK